MNSGREQQSQQENIALFPCRFGFVRACARGSRLTGLELMPEGYSPGRKNTKTPSPGPVLQRLEKAFKQHFAGIPFDFTGFELELPDTVPEFTLSVWTGCRTIPWGETRTYGELARMIGKPKAPRAVGNALNSNPFPIIIPCHRVIKSGGSPGGFGAGAGWKRFLLELERIKINDP